MTIPIIAILIVVLVPITIKITPSIHRLVLAGRRSSLRAGSGQYAARLLAATGLGRSVVLEFGV